MPIPAVIASPWLWRGAAALVLAGLVAGAWFWADRRGYERGEAAAEARWAARAEAARDRYDAELARSQALLETADGLLQELAGRGREVRWKVRETVKTDPEAKEWAETPIPESIRRVLPSSAPAPVD